MHGLAGLGLSCCSGEQQNSFYPHEMSLKSAAPNEQIRGKWNREADVAADGGGREEAPPGETQRLHSALPTFGHSLGAQTCSAEGCVSSQSHHPSSGGTISIQNPTGHLWTGPSTCNLAGSCQLEWSRA